MIAEYNDNGRGEISLFYFVERKRRTVGLRKRAEQNDNEKRTKRSP